MRINVNLVAEAVGERMVDRINASIERYTDPDKDFEDIFDTEFVSYLGGFEKRLSADEMTDLDSKVFDHPAVAAAFQGIRDSIREYHGYDDELCYCRKPGRYCSCP